jgi:aspartate/methionine/tyrosine aminotransferase
LARNLEIIRVNLALAEAFFERHTGRLGWLPPQAGSVAFPAWGGPGELEPFCRRLVERQGVMLVPGSMFEHQGAAHFRLGLGRRNFPLALSLFEKELGGI